MSDATTTPVTVTRLRKMKQAGEKIAVLTSYDAAFAKVSEEAGVDVLLVGDTLGMVVQGKETTVPVTMEDMIYHTRMVRRVTRRTLVIADFPFMTYTTPEQALENAARLMQEGGAQMVKLEGGLTEVEIVSRLSKHGIPVCAHVGLLPQSIYKLGGYRVQGRDKAAAKAILTDAKALQQAGADMIVLECIPIALAKDISQALEIPTIGIGAGVECDGQVLVLYDMLGITPGHRPKFSKDFLAGQSGGISAAISDYVKDVKSGTFPAEEHSFV